MSLKGALILLFLGCAGPVLSQFKNVMLDQQTASRAYVCEPSIAISPRHPENIVAASAPDNVYYSKDGGVTWNKSTIASPLGVFGTPVVIADPKGGFYYFHLSDATTKGDDNGGKGDRIALQRSDDGGVTWTQGESVGLNHPKHQGKQWATVDGRGNLYVTWTQFDQYGNSDPACASNILFSMSKNGKKWSDPVVISRLAGNCMDDDNTASGSVPAVTVEGKVMVAWSNQEKIFLDRSFNGGDRWLSNDIEVDEQIGGWNLPVPGHDRCNGMPVLMTDQSKGPFRGSLYILWADQRNGEDDTDIWFTRSHNFGDNWSAPLRINDDEKGKHQYLPWMTVDQETGYLYVIYYDRRNDDDLKTDVYLAYSTDGGKSFKNVLISEEPFTPQPDRFFGDHNNVSAYAGIIAPIWTRMEEGKTSVWTAIIRHEDLVKADAATTAE